MPALRHLLNLGGTVPALAFLLAVTPAKAGLLPELPGVTAPGTRAPDTLTNAGTLGQQLKQTSPPRTQLPFMKISMGDDKMGMPPPRPMPNAGGAAAGSMPMPPVGAAGPAGSMVKPPTDMMPMMKMMQGPPPDPLDHFEGRLAFLKAELGVTDAQAQAWDPFALALRTSRRHLLEARQSLSASTGQADPLTRLVAYEHHLSLRLDSLRVARESFQGLYGTLNDGQKRAANDLVLPFLETF